MRNNNTKIFAEGLSFTKLFIFFLLGSVFGSFYEEIIFFFQNGKWTVRHDLLFGPFSSLYGFGVMIYLIILGNHNKERGVIKTFLYSMFIGGFFEYIMSWFLETFLNIKFWDYSGMFLNINGRTTLLFMIAWGVMGTILLKLIYQFVSNLIEKVPYKIAQPIYLIVLIFMIINIIMSFTVFIRMVYRHKGYEPLSFIGKFYDKVYNDDFMYKEFPILKDKI